jgi:hypothetical protein
MTGIQSEAAQRGRRSLDAVGCRWRGQHDQSGLGIQSEAGQGCRWHPEAHASTTGSDRFKVQSERSCHACLQTQYMRE